MVIGIQQLVQFYHLLLEPPDAGHIPADFDNADHAAIACIERRGGVLIVNGLASRIVINLIMANVFHAFF
ncbi:Uncharacterised protein [Salmonella enterica subsp. enterica serovar Typhimurium str. DT104]|nr:Uncharacterised protein [Salmonella enterica subsp. enterica serovar Typhimurium str. DT104]